MTSSNPTKSFYDRISSAYDAIAHAGEHLARERGLEALAVQPGERVLEIGYGTGHSLVALAEAVGETGRFDGVDISDGMYEVARQRLAAAGFEQRVELKVASTPRPETRWKIRHGFHVHHAAVPAGQPAGTNLQVDASALPAYRRLPAD